MNTENFDICLLILEKLKEKNLTVAWLARQIGSDGGNLRKILNNNRDIYTALLYNISVALKEDFFVLYSERLKKIIHHYYFKVNYSSTQTEPIDICRLILEKLDEKDLSIAWLARQTGCDKDNLRKTLNNNQDIYTDLLFKISVALEEDFFYNLFRKFKKNAKKVKFTSKERKIYLKNRQNLPFKDLELFYLCPVVLAIIYNNNNDKINLRKSSSCLQVSQARRQEK